MGDNYRVRIPNTPWQWEELAEDIISIIPKVEEFLNTIDDLISMD